MIKHISLALGVGCIAAFGAYTGVRKQCAVARAVQEAMEGHMEEASAASDRDMYEGIAVLLENTHALGHMARLRWDKRAFKDIMSQFRSVVRPPRA